MKDVKWFGLDGPVDHWRKLRDDLHAEICARAFDLDLNAFVQFYGGKELDASVLLMAEVGFLPPSDPRIQGTVAARRARWSETGSWIATTRAVASTDCPKGRAFLLCTFWLADNYTLMGRHADARRLFENLLAIRNDAGLLGRGVRSRGWSSTRQLSLLFSHLGLINTARNLTQSEKPVKVRQKPRSEMPRLRAAGD